MAEKTIKIVLEDEVVEYTLEENKSLVIEIQNIADQLKINKKEKLDRLSNNFEKIQFKKPSNVLGDSSYSPKPHESSIYEILNKKSKEELEQSNSDEESKVVVDNEENTNKTKTLSQSLKDVQSGDVNELKDNKLFESTVSELYKELNNNGNETTV